MVAELTSRPARAARLADRGRIAPGLRADLNVIDLDALTLYAPRTVHDLPAGGRRLRQDVKGYLGRWSPERSPIATALPPALSPADWCAAKVGERQLRMPRSPPEVGGAVSRRSPRHACKSDCRSLAFRNACELRTRRCGEQALKLRRVQLPPRSCGKVDAVVRAEAGWRLSGRRSPCCVIVKGTRRLRRGQGHLLRGLNRPLSRARLTDMRPARRHQASTRSR